MKSASSIGNRVTRRSALKVLGGGALAAAAAGCTNTSDTGAQPGASIPTSSTLFNIPNASPALPSGKFSVRWTDSGDQKAYFFKPFFTAYQKKHPNVTVNYSGTNWTQIQQVITLGISNGSDPDVFQLPGSITIPKAVASHWIGAYDDIVPNWDQVRKSYPPGVFVNGITDFSGKTYAVPLVGGQRFNNLSMYNRDYTDRADVDIDQIISWDDWRAALKKITKQGNGKYYGILMGISATSALSDPISTMAQMAGLRGGLGIGSSLGVDWKTGEFNFTNPLAAEAIELFLAINSDGSFLPGSTSLDGAGASGRMPQGAAATLFDGPWDISLWHTQNPKFNLGLNIPAQANVKAITPTSYGPGGAGKWVYKVSSKAKPVIGDIFSYLTTAAAQTVWTKLDLAADPPPIASSLNQVGLTDTEKTSLSLAKKYMVIAPEPAVRNPDVSTVYQVIKAPTPSFSDVCVGLFTGQIKGGVKPALKGLQDRYDKALDDAIAAVNKQGGKVSRDDWVFSDWDPDKPYSKLYQS